MVQWMRTMLSACDQIEYEMNKDEGTRYNNDTHMTFGSNRIELPM